MYELFQTIPNVFPFIIDNASTYQPLLDWYSTGIQVLYLQRNAGHHAPWLADVILPAPEHKKLYGSDFYAVTDSDLDFSQCPTDFVEYCAKRIDKTWYKVGLGLEIEDLPPDTKPVVYSWEAKYWTKPVDQFFDAPIDTTFCLYRADLPHAQAMKIRTPTLRAGYPYVARHMPWYESQMTEEEKQENEYFYQTCNASSSWRPGMTEYNPGKK